MNTQRSKVTRYLLGAGGLALAMLLSSAPAAQAKTETNAASLSVAITAQADVASHSDGVDTYQLTVTNQGGAQIKGVTLRVPIADGYQLAGASFDADDAWVSSRDAGQATIRIEGMRGVGDSVSGALIFAGPADSATSALEQRLLASWSTDTEDFSAQSNLPVAGVQALQVASTAQGLSLSSAIFAPGEPVNFWYTTSAGASTPLVVVDGVLGLQPAKSDIEEIAYSTYSLADADGAVAVPLSLAGIPAGSYTLVARGNWSGATASARVNVP